MGYDIEGILLQDDNFKNIYKQALTDNEFIRILNKYDKVYFIELLQKDTKQEFTEDVIRPYK